MKHKYIKKIICLCLAMILSLAVCPAASGCAKKAPKVEEIYDRVVELVEAANEINTVFYGAGLPVYAADSLYARISNLYYDFEYANAYEMVTEYAKFLSETEIKMSAEKVYSAAYLEEVLYPAAFTGYAVSGISGGVQVASARYLEDGEWIYQSVKEDALYTSGMIVYDYSTMAIARPSNAKACYVTMNAWMENTPEEVHTVRLRLVLQEGQWYLDAFTGGIL